jgi:hypothetical protein
MTLEIMPSSNYDADDGHEEELQFMLELDTPDRALHRPSHEGHRAKNDSRAADPKLGMDGAPAKDAKEPKQ